MVLYRYYIRHGRIFPWRKEKNAYLILITELLLQKTKAEDVACHWKDIKKHLGSPSDCLKAGSFLTKLFKRLGLPKRKKWIVKIAQTVLKRGYIPNTLTEIQLLPGVGPYTGRATIAFAFNSNNGIVDSNFIRVFERFWGSVSHHDLRQKVRFWLPISLGLGGKRVFKSVYWGLLDLSSKICKHHLPRCSECPLKYKCRSAFKL